MTCFMCKGNLESKTSTFMVDLGNCIIIIKDVPSEICSQCGEISYSNNVALQLQKIINSMRKTITEIAVVHYSDRVA